MAGVIMGVQELKEIVVLSSKVLNLGSKLIHGNFLSLLAAPNLYVLLKGVDLEKAKKEIQDLDPNEREDVLSTFVMSLDLEDRDVQNKIISTVDVVSVALDSVKDVVKVIEDVKLVVSKFKQIYGVK